MYEETEEAKFLVEEVDLYGDLIRIEEEAAKAKRNQEIELESCKKEIERLRESVGEKSTRIEELSKEKEKLLRSLCSLYKTGKSEIERKDELLAEANRKIRKLESILYQKNEHVARQTRCYRCQNCNHENENDNNSDKRSESPTVSSNATGFNSDATIPPPNLACSSYTSKSQGMHLKELLFDKSSHAVPSVSTSSFLTPSSEDHNSVTKTDKFAKNELDRNFSDTKKVSARDKSVRAREKYNIRRSNRRDLEDTLFRHRRERIPYSEREKFSHRNNRNFVHKKL